LTVQFNTVFEVQAQEIEKRRRKAIKIKNKEVKLYLSTDDMTQKILNI
jgi:hypothetical protein